MGCEKIINEFEDGETHLAHSVYRIHFKECLRHTTVSSKATVVFLENTSLGENRVIEIVYLIGIKG